MSGDANLRGNVGGWPTHCLVCAPPALGIGSGTPHEAAIPRGRGRRDTCEKAKRRLKTVSVEGKWRSQVEGRRREEITWQMVGDAVILKHRNRARRVALLSARGGKSGGGEPLSASRPIAGARTLSRSEAVARTRRRVVRDGAGGVCGFRREAPRSTPAIRLR